LRVQVGTERQDYLLSFIEPWFLGRKLSWSGLIPSPVEFPKPGNLYDEVRTGGRVSLSRALWRIRSSAASATPWRTSGFFSIAARTDL